jgi:hypothetical protein
MSSHRNDRKLAAPWAGGGPSSTYPSSDLDVSMDVDDVDAGGDGALLPDGGRLGDGDGAGGRKPEGGADGGGGGNGGAGPSGSTTATTTTTALDLESAEDAEQRHRLHAQSQQQEQNWQQWQQWRQPPDYITADMGQPQAPAPDRGDDDMDDHDSAIGSLYSVEGGSLTESIRAYRTINGRSFHAERGNAKHWAANDSAHAESAELHYYVINDHQGCLFHAPLDVGNVSRVLDVGTGNGLWAM